ncbi:extensin family protein [Ancylobacter dichloromethanicus]|uniref:Extensin-like C-terminal domain-containing protein n=1 Tax=Ancylobacter dichloromethanicus TaxID=518825 RepID=A0A9W6JAB9_9HYPH|nr:extensin family protein [Ancylobacter dichloromethanicus]MBS7552112.1 extensin family protein [Ancylobacter dichloromethanicus]GLK73845.1 hypothetical protein GCM10017643_39630 [Ancylobacter dichloromethanicus]
MDFSSLPSGRFFPRSGLAGLALLMAGTFPLSAEPMQELKRSIDEAGTAVNRQLGDWLGVAPEKPARRSTRARKPNVSTAIPLPPRRPSEEGARADAAVPAAKDTAADTAVSAPVTLAPPHAAPPPAAASIGPPSSRPSKPVVAAPQQGGIHPEGATDEAPDAPEPVAPDRAKSEGAARMQAATASANVAPSAPIPLPMPGPERQIAALPPVPPPVSRPSGEPQTSEPRATAVPTICPELSNEDLGVFTPVAVTATNTACTVDRGVSLSAVRMKDGRLVTLEPAATLRCEMAAAVARWLRDGVEPAVATLGAPLDKVLVAASQQCRPRNRVAGAKISEHGRGNAIDTRGYVLTDGRRFVIGTPAAGSADQPMPVAFQESLKASACADFTTILGPGSDGYHELHLHVDRAERRSGAVLCRWAVADTRAKAPSPPRKPEIPAASDQTEAAKSPMPADPDTSPALESPGTSQ